MGEHCVILVDAGYLLAAAGTRVAGTSLRSAVRVDYPKLVGALAQLAEEDSGLEMLRLYWYDASKDGLLDEAQKHIAMLPGVKVRLGRISFNGDQKGVDLKLGLDLVGAARHRAASVAYIVSGDDDLAEAVEAAQELGMRVVIVGLENKDHRLGVLSVSEDLVLRADRLLCLPGEAADAAITRATRPAPVLAGPEPPRGAASVPVPSPAAVAALRRSVQPGSVPPTIARPTAPPIVYSTGPDGSVSAETTVLGDVAREVGAAVAESWYASTTQAELNAVLADRPVLPVEIDRVLLRDCARRIGEPDTDRQFVRRELRNAFWERLDLLR